MAPTTLSHLNCKCFLGKKSISKFFQSQPIQMREDLIIKLTFFAWWQTHLTVCVRLHVCVCVCVCECETKLDRTFMCRCPSQHLPVLHRMLKAAVQRWKGSLTGSSHSSDTIPRSRGAEAISIETPPPAILASSCHSNNPCFGCGHPHISGLKWTLKPFSLNDHQKEAAP